MLSIFTAIKVVALVCYLALALLALRSKAAIRVRIYFSIYLFGMLGWQLGSVVVVFTPDRGDALLAYNLMVASSGSYTVLFFSLTRALLGIGRQRILAGLSYAVCVVEFVTAIAGLQFKEVVLGRGGYWVPLYTETTMYVLSLLSFSFWGLGVTNLVRALRRESSPLKRNRIGYILIGASVTILGASTNLIGFRDYPVDISANLASALIIGYAVFRHRLLDIRFLLARSLFYSFLTGGVILFYIGLVFGLGGILRGGARPSQSAAELAALLVLAFLFLPLRNAVQRLIDRLFFREREDYQRAVQVFSGRIASSYDEEEILGLILSTLLGSAKLSGAAILLRDPLSGLYRLRRVGGKDPSLALLQPEDGQAPLLRRLRSSGKPIVREELLLEEEEGATLRSGSLLFESRAASALAPILLEDRLLGVLVLGRKLSGLMWNAEDLGFVSTIASQSATALDRCEIFLRINRRLSEQTLLFVLSEKFRGSPDFDPLMGSVVQTLRTFLSPELCGFLILGRDGQAASYANDRLSELALCFLRTAWEGLRRDLPGLGFDPLELGARLRAAAAGRRDPESLPSDVLDALTLVPLSDGPRLLGILCLARSLGRGAGKREDEELLKTIGSIVAQGLVLHRTLFELLTLESYNEKILNSLNDMGDTLLILDEGGRIRKVNRAACRLLEREEEDLLGRDVEEILAEDEGLLSREGLRAVLDGRPVSNRELSYRSRSGETIPMLFSGSALALEPGAPREIIGIARDMRERLKAEEASKNLLLVQEIHHRIKNNLQVISSLLSLQSNYVLDPEVKAMFKESQGRVKSMALIHERLYRSDKPESMDFSAYIMDLSRNLQLSYGSNPSQIRLKFDVQEVRIGMDTAVPCGLLINELVSNAFKHAFPEGRGGVVSVSLKPAPAVSSEEEATPHYELVVEDDGVGFAEEKPLESYPTLGLRIVTTLSRQLHGKVQLSTGPGRGSRFALVFKELA